MSKKIPYFIVDPGGNTTAIVPGVFNIAKRKRIALNLLHANKKVEQVGFWMPAKTQKAAGRLEMAGGEFCGNATRALASIINKKKSFFLETSGLREPVKVQASQRKSSVTLPLSAFRIKKDVCSLPGITHILNSRSITKRKAKEMLRSKHLLSRKASGVIGYKKTREGAYEITATVWVRDIRTLYDETACASGTAALAYRCWKLEGVRKLRIKQPSGAIFRTEIRGGMLKIEAPIRGKRAGSLITT
ncbi:hypothetical protein C4568_01380 [Candidatus Parcubacteria bacterium]|nr:MAG: hypothetical protein C4568_01380 [Candidatus Parcubacteria bacterium]